MGIFDVPPSELIKEVARDLKTKIEKPEWINYVKSGASRERAPLDTDFWFVRNASILYRIYKEGPLGTGSLRSYYGGRKNRGVKPEHHRKASGKIIRTCLQELEKKGFIKKEKKGRLVTPMGEKYLFAISKTVEQNLIANPIVKKKKRLTSTVEAKARDVTAALKGREKKKEEMQKEKKKEKVDKK